MLKLRYNWEIYGHKNWLVALETDLQNSNLAHAYLFAGPASIGKYTVAKRFAKILQCENDFCNNCKTCAQIDKGYHDDTLEIIDDGESLKVETIRQVLRSASMTAQNNHRLVLIDNIERMTPEAANALLKTLEDPPPKVIFLLTTGNLDNLLSTIISRARLCKFAPLDAVDLLEFLKNFFSEKSAEDLQKVIKMSFGRPGKAAALLGNDELFVQQRSLLEKIEVFVEKPDIAEQFTYIAEIAKDFKMVKFFLDGLINILRDRMLLALDKGLASRGIKNALLAKSACKAIGMMEQNVNNRLLLENLMLEL